jgi:hypothetical protein
MKEELGGGEGSRRKGLARGKERKELQGRIAATIYNNHLPSLKRV